MYTDRRRTSRLADARSSSSADSYIERCPRSSVATIRSSRRIVTRRARLDRAIDTDWYTPTTSSQPFARRSEKTTSLAASSSNQLLHRRPTTDSHNTSSVDLYNRRPTAVRTVRRNVRRRRCSGKAIAIVRTVKRSEAKWIGVECSRVEWSEVK